MCFATQSFRTNMTASTVNDAASGLSATPVDLEKDHPVDVADYRERNGPLLSYRWCNEGNLAGQTMYLGSEVGADGKIYFIPGNATQVLVCETSTDRVSLVGPKFSGKLKWLRGVSVDGGKRIYGLPCHSDQVLRIDVENNSITTIPIPYETFYSTDSEKARNERFREWKYHGGALSPDGSIYAVPQSALHVLKIDPSTDSCELVGPELPGRCKWYGGVVGNDGAMYAIPHNSSHVLRILNADSITLHGDFGSGGHKWHGAAKSSNGDVVSVPANADTVLCIRPKHPEPELYQLGDSSCVRTGRHRKDSKYKYLGALCGPDGKVYCFPSGSERVLQVDTVRGIAREVGPNLFDERMERLCQNKWQNGVAFGQYVYAIPLAAESLLRIDCSCDPPDVTTWPLPAPYRGLAKFEGAIVAKGAIYTVPNNHKAILRIEASRQLQAGADPVGRRMKPDDGGLTYRSGIPTLRSSAHRVKYNTKNRRHDPKPKNRVGEETGTDWLPEPLCREDVFSFDISEYNLVDSVRALLRKCDNSMVGAFREGSDRLEDFEVPVKSTWRNVNGGQVEVAQHYLSDVLAHDETFLHVFDSFLQTVVLPYLKSRLVDVGAIDSKQEISFFYQRPPTLRLQPGPAWAQVKAHNDAEYGHQNGELVSAA